VGYNATTWASTAIPPAVLARIQKQSADIAMGVDTGGAGDQGMMFGFACDETSSLMPLPIAIAHALTHRQADLRANRPELGLRPDAKSQVTIAYDAAGRPSHVDTLVLSTQHHPDLSHEQVEAIVEEHIFEPVLAQFGQYVEKGSADIKRYVNPTGRFVIGGPQGDTGLTGRKIIVDTYGGYARHGGGAFSGKDPTKVDRSAAYAPATAPKVVPAGLAKKCEIQLAYAIGVAEPVACAWNFGTAGQASTSRSASGCGKRSTYPKGVIDLLDLRRPIYRETARTVHFATPRSAGKRPTAPRSCRGTARRPHPLPPHRLARRLPPSPKLGRGGARSAGVRR
jgi:S-adenosylmethionine synthetase